MLYTEDFSIHHCVAFSQIGSHIFNFNDNDRIIGGKEEW